MASRGYKVKTTVDTMILNVTPVQSRLIPKVSVVLLINVVNDRLPTVGECIYNKQYNGLFRLTHKSYTIVLTFIHV